MSEAEREIQPEHQPVILPQHIAFLRVMLTWSWAGVWRLLEDDSDRVIRGLILFIRLGVGVKDDAGLSEENTGAGVRKTYNWTIV